MSTSICFDSLLYHPLSLPKAISTKLLLVKACSCISSAEMSVMVKTEMDLPTKVAKDMLNVLVGTYITVDFVLVLLDLEAILCW